MCPAWAWRRRLSSAPLPRLSAARGSLGSAADDLDDFSDGDLEDDDLNPDVDPSKLREQRARMALQRTSRTAASRRGDSLSEAARAERTLVLVEIDHSLQLQQELLVDLGGLESDAGVAGLMRRSARDLEEERRTLSGTHRLAPAAANPLAVGEEGSSSVSGIVTVPAAPRADTTHDLRRHCSALFEACQRLEFGGEQLARLASSATAELPPDVRALLLRRRDAVRRERDFLSRRMAMIAQRMHADFEATNVRKMQHEWLASEMDTAPTPHVTIAAEPGAPAAAMLPPAAAPAAASIARNIRSTLGARAGAPAATLPPAAAPSAAACSGASSHAVPAAAHAPAPAASSSGQRSRDRSRTWFGRRKSA